MKGWMRGEPIGSKINAARRVVESLLAGKFEFFVSVQRGKKLSRGNPGLSG
jgi:hypothetical protein